MHFHAPVRVPLLFAIGGASLLSAGVIGVVELRRFVAESPRFCAQCHKASPEFALWASDRHARVACQKCHHSTPDQGLAMLGAFVSGKEPGRSGERHAPVEIGACASCHLSHDPGWVQVGASRGHRVHAVEQKIDCVRCHGGGVHRFEPAASSCKGCHGEHTVNAPGMQKLHCFACHDFLSADGALRPTRRDCLRCHNAEGVHPARFADGAPMQFACAACHKPHATKGAAIVACESCHDSLRGLHDTHRDCRQCHRPHGWRSEPADCLRCHKEGASHFGHLTCSACHAWRG